MIYALMDGTRVVRTQIFSNPPNPQDGWVYFAEVPKLETREDKKEARQSMVDSIVVTVNGKQFDGDEISQNRMSRAIVALQAASVTQTYWTLADNQVAQVTLGELAEALIKSGMEQTRLWSIE